MAKNAQTVLIVWNLTCTRVKAHQIIPVALVISTARELMPDLIWSGSPGIQWRVPELARHPVLPVSHKMNSRGWHSQIEEAALCQQYTVYTGDFA